MVSDLLPSHLGLPARFQEFRPNQADVACEIAASDKRFSFLSMPTGGGKCHPAGTKVLLADGLEAAVEDLRVGDLLMGPDSKPRTVLELHEGAGQLYRVQPVKGEPWEITHNHLLTLVRTNDGTRRAGEIVDVPLSEWLRWSKTRRHLYKLFRVSVEFQPKERLPISPYFLGLLLGDGTATTGTYAISKPDPEIEAAVREFAATVGCEVHTRGRDSHFLVAPRRGQFNRWRKHPLHDPLLHLGLLGKGASEKFIPTLYRLSSRQDRSLLLAGLLDTDGSLTHSGYDFISKSKRLADDTAFVARSLGLAAYVTRCQKQCQGGFVGDYFRVSISGDASFLPIRIPRKKAPARQQKKSVLRTGFSVRPSRVDQFYGFTLDGDGRYLLSDFTVTHNSLVYMTVSKLLDARTLILVGTKGLQAQITNDFLSLGLVEIKGQSNYRCLALNVGGELEGLGSPGSSCAEGPCKADIACSMKRAGCLYYDTVRAAGQSKIVVSNYSYWLTIGRHADPLSIGKFDLLILDEAHGAPDWLAAHCVVNLDRNEVRSLLRMELPPVDEGVHIWASWAKEAAIVAGERIAAYRHAIEENDYQLSIGTNGGGTRLDRRRVMKELLRLISLRRDLDALAQAHAWRSSEGPAQDVRMPGQTTDWVAQVTDDGAKFTPVWGHPYAESYLYRGIPKVVLSSATLMPAITRYLGISEEESDWHEVRSGFDPKRRPVIYLSTTRVDKNMNEGQKRVWVNRIDAVVRGRLDRKGIVATVSYARAREVVERSKFRQHMLTHDSRSTREVVERFKRAEPPCVLVSPVMVEGFDFPYDLCRFIIIAKLPFGDGRDPVEKARRKSDKEWPNYATSLDLVQTAGRGMRAADDLCEIFIIDDHWAWYRRAVKWPKWFSEAFRQGNMVPVAPNLT